MACGVYCFHRSVCGRFSCLGAIGYQYWAQQNAYSGLEEYAEVDDNSNLALSDLKVDWDGLRAINPTS